MRKAIWCSVAVAVLATLGVFFASRYAVSHPESFLARVAWNLTPARFEGNAVVHACVPAAPVDEDGPDVDSPRRQQQRDLFEPIVVVPGDNPEPPVAQFPLLPPNPVVIAEESEVPVMPFVEDDPDLFMPYADDDDELPVPAVWNADGIDAAVRPVCVEVEFSFTKSNVGCAAPNFQCVTGLLGLPGNFLHMTLDSVWQTIHCGMTTKEPVRTSAFGRSVPSVANPATEEEADQGTDDPAIEDVTDYHRNHRMYCPYTGNPCPQVYRTTLPMSPRPTQPAPTPSEPTTPR